MDTATDEQLEEAKNFMEFYTNLVNNTKDTLIYYLSDSATIDWFGKTIKGEKNMNTFIKTTLSSVKHNFSKTVPTKKIGFRDVHVIKESK